MITKEHHHISDGVIGLLEAYQRGSHTCNILLPQSRDHHRKPYDGYYDRARTLCKKPVFDRS